MVDIRRTDIKLHGHLRKRSGHISIDTGMGQSNVSLHVRISYKIDHPIEQGTLDCYVAFHHKISFRVLISFNVKNLSLSEIHFTKISALPVLGRKKREVPKHFLLVERKFIIKTFRNVHETIVSHSE